MEDEEDPGELQRALARPDASKLIEQIDAYVEYFANGAGDWPDERADDFTEILTCVHDDPDRALAYVMISAARTDNAAFLRLMGQSFEPLLYDPAPAFLARIVAEARRSARFRWLLSNPVKELISDVAWDAIEAFRFTGPHEEPSADLLPPRVLN
jgi:hypothetical protein